MAMSGSGFCHSDRSGGMERAARRDMDGADSMGSFADRLYSYAWFIGFGVVLAVSWIGMNLKPARSSDSRAPNEQR